MNRIIINNKTDLSDIETLYFIRDVMSNGRISNNNKQYCYLTQYEYEGRTIQVATDLRKKSDSFTIIEVNSKK